MLAARDGINGPLAPWDWRYYAEKERKSLHDLDEAEIKPYLVLDNIIAAAFRCCRPAVLADIRRSRYRVAAP